MPIIPRSPKNEKTRFVTRCANPSARVGHAVCGQHERASSMTLGISMPSFVPAKLVPELLITDMDASLRFWCDLCGFVVVYHRLHEGFAYLDRDGAQVMLEERGRGRNWITADLEAPFGRGANFQISVKTLAPILEALRRANWPLFFEAEQKRYCVDGIEIGVHQFLVQDPDGYLVRFSASLGLQSPEDEAVG
jgi:catechol 2,3-dioxygenase-like lactoylglutathione lyase family enzyme